MYVMQLRNWTSTTSYRKVLQQPNHIKEKQLLFASEKICHGVSKYFCKIYFGIKEKIKFNTLDHL